MVNDDEKVRDENERLTGDKVGASAEDGETELLMLVR